MERVLGVAIGIAVVCLLLSILASHLQEIWASYTGRRAASLVSAIESMLGRELAGDFFDHPLLETISFSKPRVSVSLSESKVMPAKQPKDATPSRPTYIAASLFSRVLYSVLQQRASAGNETSRDAGGMAAKPPSLSELVRDLPDRSVKRRLGAVIAGTEHETQASVLALEQWYDGTMDRINGLYKKNTQNVLLLLGIALAILCNANIFSITEKLWTSEDARTVLSTTAQMYSCKPGNNCTIDDYKQARVDISDNLENYIPIGYHQVNKYWGDAWSKIQGPKSSAYSIFLVVWDWILHLAGWGLTGVAVSLGAPFWFDVVNKLINIRLVGDKPARTEPPAIGSQPLPVKDEAKVSISVDTKGSAVAGDGAGSPDPGA